MHTHTATFLQKSWFSTPLCLCWYHSVHICYRVSRLLHQMLCVTDVYMYLFVHVHVCVHMLSTSHSTSLRDLQIHSVLGGIKAKHVCNHGVRTVLLVLKWHIVSNWLSMSWQIEPMFICRFVCAVYWVLALCVETVTIHFPNWIWERSIFSQNPIPCSRLAYTYTCTCLSLLPSPFLTPSCPQSPSPCPLPLHVPSSNVTPDISFLLSLLSLVPPSPSPPPLSLSTEVWCMAILRLILRLWAQGQPLSLVLRYLKISRTQSSLPFSLVL